MEESKQIDFERDSLRFTYDAYLIEYQSIRSEIETRLDLQERTINYLLVLVAAALSASQLFGELTSQLTDFVWAYPFTLLILAIVSLYFPHSVTTNNIYMAVLGAYENNVLSPKIDAIARLLSARSESTKEFVQWEKQNFPEWLCGVLRWDDYRARAMFTRRSSLMFGILAFFSSAFVSLPSFFFLSLFLFMKREQGNLLTKWSSMELFLIALFGIVTLSLIWGIVFGQRAYLGIARLRRNEIREPLYD